MTEELLIIHVENPLWARLRDSMLQHTFGRQWFHIGGSIEPGDEPLDMDALEDSGNSTLRRIALALSS